MTMPSPYELGKATGGSIMGAGHRAIQGSTMDDILKQAQETGDPTQFNNIMSQILQRVDPENQANVINAVKQRQQQLQQQQGGAALANILEKPEMAEQFSQLPLDLQKEVTKGLLEQKKQLMIQAAKAPEQPKLSQQTTQFLKDKNKAFEAADVVKDVGERMMGLVDSISAGKGTMQGMGPAMFKSDEVAEFESLTFDLLPHYKSMFPRGITNAEFKKISEGALPKLGLSPSANKARIQKFMDRADKVLKQKSSLEAIQDRFGFIPENISNLISKEDSSNLEKEEKVLDKNMAIKFLEAADGNKDKAREMAKEAGYKF